eukprot:452777_1
MPQIVLQLRILWVIRWSGNNESANFKINETTLIWSIVLACVHLVLEAGIIFLDSKALRMSFMQYAFVCLGARVQWIPYQHLIANIVKNQIYIFYETDTPFNANLFCDSRFVPKVTEDLILDYESIHFLNYPVLYQFSKKSMHKLSQKFINCEPIVFPPEIHLSSTNQLLQNLMSSVLCKSQLKIGYNSAGNIDIYSLCELYQSTINKVMLNVREIDDKTMRKMIRNTKNGVEAVERKIIDELICFGEISIVNWVDKPSEIKESIKNTILENCLSKSETDESFSRIDILRNCFLNKFYIGTTCDVMTRVLRLVEKELDKCEQNMSWCFAVSFIVLYTSGNAFFDKCDHGCCEINALLKQMIRQCFPVDITVDNLQYPIEMWYYCKAFTNFFHISLEEILINSCKKWMVSKKIDEHLIFKDLNFPSKETQFEQKYINTLVQVINRDPTIKLSADLNLKRLDELVFSLQLHSRYAQYLKFTAKYRTYYTYHDEMKTNDNNQSPKQQKVTIGQLLPHNIQNEKDTIQISSMTITVHTLSVLEHSQSDDKFKDETASCKIYIQTSDMDDVTYLKQLDIDVEELFSNTSLQINVTVNGLNECNYMLLNGLTELDQLQSIVMEFNSPMDIQIDKIEMNTKYFKFYEYDGNKFYEYTKTKSQNFKEKKLAMIGNSMIAEDLFM